MASHNQLIKVFSDIAAAHLQLRSFGNGDPLNIGNNVAYPLMWAVQQSGSVSISAKNDTHSFVLIFADLLNADSSNESEVLSDMRLVALDVLAQLQLSAYNDTFEVESTARIEPFSHEIPNGNTADMVAGWTLNISLRTDYLSNHCAVPSTLDPTAATPVVCEPVLVYQSGVLVATVAAGGRYDIDPTECQPVTITNSDLSVNTQISSGGFFELADSVAKNSLGNIVDQKPYGQELSIANSIVYKADGVTTLLTIAAAQGKTIGEAIDLMTGAEIYTELSPAQIAAIYEAMPVTGYVRPQPSGQTTSYALYDDAWIAANVLNDAPTGKINRLAAGSIDTLVYNNAFGNKNLWTGINGNQTFTDGYAINHLNGLGFYTSSRPIAAWADALNDYTGYTLNVAGNLLSGFFVLNIKTMELMRRHNLAQPNRWGAFPLIADVLWTSTTDPTLTTRGKVFNSTTYNNDFKTNAKAYMIARKHYSN